MYDKNKITGNMVHFKSLLGLWFCVLLFIEGTYAQSYKATVVAYKVENNPLDLPRQILLRNKERYVTIINESKDQTDIIVFPEYGITTFKPDSLLRAHLEPFSITVPEPGTQSFTDAILSGISSGARSNGVYVVINVLEKSNVTSGENSEKFYSTDVVFGPDGSLVAKCRKKYLLSKTANYDKGSSNQKCTFTAKFTKINQNVNFALLFDTDIVESIQETVHDGILTSALPNKLPLSFGLSLHLGFSLGNKINLLVSAYTDTSEGSGGTGIYLRNGTSKVTLGTDLFVNREVPINQNINKKVDVAVTSPIKPDVLENLKYEDITTLSTNNIAASETFADGLSYCKLHMDSNVNDTQPYKWVAYAGTKEILGQLREVLICGLIKPEGSKDQTKIINSITVDTATEAKNIIQVLPLSLSKKSGGTIAPTRFQFEEDNSDGVKNIKLKLTKPEDLITFGVLFILRSAVSHGTSVHISYMSLVGTLSLILFLRFRYM